MAAAYGDARTKELALEDALPKVARTASHLFQFIEYVDDMRGWGRSLKRGINNWYISKTPENLVYQTIKYRNRNNWTHRDVLRKTHPISYDHNNLFGYLTNKHWVKEDPAARLINAFEDAKTMDTKQLVNHIREHNLTWEMLPTEALKNADIWRAMLPEMPATALMRNLGRLSTLDIIKPLSAESTAIASNFNNPEWVKKARLHPLNVLLAYYTYNMGHGWRGGT